MASLESEGFSLDEEYYDIRGVYHMITYRMPPLSSPVLLEIRHLRIPVPTDNPLGAMLL